jgi:hypothetical protein
MTDTYYKYSEYPELVLQVILYFYTGCRIGLRDIGFYM